MFGRHKLCVTQARPSRAAIDSSSCGAHAYMLGASFGVRAADDGHLTLLKAHGAVVCARQEWLLLAAAVATQSVLMPQGTV
jgi:hypothetical protein